MTLRQPGSGMFVADSAREAADIGKSNRPTGSAVACVLGGIDLVQALGLAGIRSTVIARPGNLSRYSRFTSRVLDAVDATHPEAFVERLISFAKHEPERPVLYYSGDWELLAISRFRDRLGEFFRYLMPDAALIETLVDKARFQGLAEELGLPVPRAQCLLPEQQSSSVDLDVEFPIIVKPLTRNDRVWRILARGKALRVESPQRLRELWPRFIAANAEILVQELVPGPETQVESYHVYISDDGGIRGEFAGRKIRTHPKEFGYSTALVTTDNEDVFKLGRELSRRLGLKGVAKFDFKRSRDGRLYLLEINPRFNLWHHVGAKAGVNLPELAYHDLARPSSIGRPRAIGRAGACWCSPRHDLQAARKEGIGFVQWLAWAARCDAKSGFSRHDPLPIIRGTAWRLAAWLRRGARLAPGQGASNREDRRPQDAPGNDPT
jgi:D-aspartate ligase